MNAQARKRQKAFLETFAKTGTIVGACRSLGISRETVRQWRKKDPAFEQAFQDADLDVTEILETKAMQQALTGDTVMTIFLLKARRPEVYRDYVKHEVSGEITETRRLVLVFPEADKK